MCAAGLEMTYCIVHNTSTHHDELSVLSFRRILRGAIIQYVSIQNVRHVKVRKGHFYVADFAHFSVNPGLSVLFKQ